jgi:hypothetical protein
MTTHPQTIEEQATFFRENGFVIVPNAVSPEILRSLQETCTALRNEPNGQGTLRNLLAHSAVFEPLIDSHAAFPLLEHLFGNDIQLLAMDMRTCPPGSGQMAWHVDMPFFANGTIVSINTALYIDDLIPENGALRLVPRSHLTRFSLPAEEQYAPLPGEVIVECAAGTMVIFSDNLWHRTGENSTDKPRRGIFTYYGHYWVKQCGYAEKPIPIKYLQQYIEGKGEKRQQIMGVWLKGSEFNPIGERFPHLEL